MMDVAFASPDEREEIAQFMVTAFPRAKWDITGWRRLLANRWGVPGDPFALRVKDKGRVVGCLGIVTARRRTAAGPAVTAGMSSWYMLKEYRGTGAGKEMLCMAINQPGVTVLNFASAVKAAPVVEAAGMVPLETHRHIWLPGGGPPLDVTLAPATLPDLSEVDAQVLADHNGLNLSSFWIMTPEGPLVICLCVKKKHPDYTSHELFYTGDRALFSRYARRIADSVVPAGGALCADARMVVGAVSSDRFEPLSIPRYYTDGHMAPEDVDLMYSENLLLDIKIH